MEQKYNVGDKVSFDYHGVMRTGVIDKVYIDSHNYVSYTVKGIKNYFLDNDDIKLLKNG